MSCSTTNLDVDANILGSLLITETRPPNPRYPIPCAALISRLIPPPSQRMPYLLIQGLTGHNRDPKPPLSRPNGPPGPPPARPLLKTGDYQTSGPLPESAAPIDPSGPRSATKRRFWPARTVEALRHLFVCCLVPALPNAGSMVVGARYAPSARQRGSYKSAPTTADPFPSQKDISLIN